MNLKIANWSEIMCNRILFQRFATCGFQIFLNDVNNDSNLEWMRYQMMQ
jgi:hypothetical protein